MSQSGNENAAAQAHEIPIQGDDEATETAGDQAAEAQAEPEVVEAEVIEEEPEAAEDEGDAEAEVSAEDDAAAEADAAVADAERLVQAEATAAAMRDKYLRLQAEWDNFRKRTAEEASQQRARAAEGLMSDILPVIDDFERAIAHAESNGEAGMLEGVKAISTKLSEVLSKHGLEEVNPAGQAFDPNEHQAVGTVEDTEVPDETVSQVYQKGYRLGKKLIRPAMVTISSGGPKREPEAASDEE